MAHQIFTFQPLVYADNDERFRVTNLGAIVGALTDLGCHAQQIALAPSDDMVGQEIDGIRLCSLHQATDPQWWQSLKPWAVITNTWGAPRFNSIRQAILGATPRLLDRLDTDGARSPHICLPSYLYRDWSSHCDSRKLISRKLAFWQAVGQAIIMKSLPGLLDKLMTSSLAAIPAVTAESPIATERMRRFQKMFGFSGSNIYCSPFPVALGPLDNLSLDKKQNRVISVGRWEAHQKNFPLLLRVLNDFLAVHPDWDAVLPGSRHPEEEKLLQRCCSQTRSRIRVTGPLPNQKIQRQMAESKIFLMASRHESFGIAAAEALCLGCSVVGPSHIPSIPWFCGSDSGTVAATYSKNGLVDALAAEAEAWKNIQRDGKNIAKIWHGRVSSNAVCRQMLHHLESILDSQ